MANAELSSLKERLQCLEHMTLVLLQRQLEAASKDDMWKVRAEQVCAQTKVHLPGTPTRLKELLVETPRLVLMPITHKDKRFMSNLCFRHSDVRNMAPHLAMTTYKDVVTRVTHWAQKWEQNDPASALLIMRKKKHPKGHLILEKIGVLVCDEQQDITVLLNREAWHGDYFLEAAIAWLYVLIPLLREHPHFVEHAYFPSPHFTTKCRLGSEGLQVAYNRLGFAVRTLMLEQGALWVHFMLHCQALTPQVQQRLNFIRPQYPPMTPARQAAQNVELAPLKRAKASP